MNLMNNGNKVSFFKILLRDDIDFLPLPVSFAKKYLKNKNNQTLVLKTGSTLKWKVKFLEIEDRYYFIHGWLNFIKHNNLQMGDFVVFWLLSPSNFQVFIYAPNGCLKNPTTTSSKVAGGGRSKNIHKILKKPFVKDKTSDDDDDSKENVQQSFCRTVSKTCIRTLSMNKRFVKDHLVINGNGRVVLRNKDGKMWEVKVSIYGVGKVPYLTQGWYDFIRDNKIKIGDKCEFNHVNNNLLHIHVLKKKKGRPFIKNP